MTNKVEANPELVINNLANRIAQLERENAVLLALLQEEKESGVGE